MPTAIMKKEEKNMMIRQKLIAACACLLLAGSVRADEGTLTVRFEGLNNDKGTVRLALFNSEEAYKADREEKTMLRGASAPIQDGQSEISLPALPFGVYAFKVFHDENSNEKLDKNMLGIPKEQYAFSNNAAGEYGIPPFAEASFTFDADTTVTVLFK
ncbi:MAG: DUF2141 domain-containing protein [Spartobacteria bacterium]|nr:DUF2141 domain-containing protein [Spartobacteria bacterium]